MDKIPLPYTLPEEFLSQPKPDIKKQIVNFKKVGLPEYDGFYACVLDDVLTAEECVQLTRAAESTTNGSWEKAMINVGSGKQVMATETRNCGRIVWDDREIVAKIWARCRDAVPELSEIRDQPKIAPGSARKKDAWRMTRLNERMRFLSYVEGNYFRRELTGCSEEHRLIVSSSW